MAPITWFYTWTSKDHVFHHILKTSFEEHTDLFSVHPINLNDESNKFELILQYMLKQEENKQIMISDSNVLIDNLPKLHEYLMSFTAYEYVGLREDFRGKKISTNTMLVKNTEAVRNFFKELSEGKTPLPTDLNHSSFTSPQFCKSNTSVSVLVKSFVIELVSLYNTFDENYFHKLFIVSTLVDITALEPLIPYTIWNLIIDAHKQIKTDLPIMYFNYKSQPWHCEPTLKDSHT
jgi:hypothetical protein